MAQIETKVLRTMRGLIKGLVAGAVAAAALIATPVHADVKAGVDAWSAGDYATAVAEWQVPAQNGDADALFNLAQAYRLGRGVPADINRARQLMTSPTALRRMNLTAGWLLVGVGIFIALT